MNAATCQSCGALVPRSHSARLGPAVFGITLLNFACFIFQASVNDYETRMVVLGLTTLANFAFAFYIERLSGVRGPLAYTA